METRTAGIWALTLLSWTAVASAQAPRPIEPDLAQLAGGKGLQLINRSLTIVKEGGRTVARLDARTGDGAARLDGVRGGLLPPVQLPES